MSGPSHTAIGASLDRQIECFVPGDTLPAGIEITFRTGVAHRIDQAIRCYDNIG
jgi:hypothetical protein